MTDTGEPFGQQRLEAVLGEAGSGAAEETARALLRATDRHLAGNGEAADDRTVVVLRVIGNPEGSLRRA